MRDLLNFSMLITGAARDRNKNGAAAKTAAELVALARLESADALKRLDSNPDNGLDPAQVEARLAEFGPNMVAQEKKKPFLWHILEGSTLPGLE